MPTENKERDVNESKRSYTDADESQAADNLMAELGMSVDRDSDMWRCLKLGIAKGIGMGYDKITEILL